MLWHWNLHSVERVGIAIGVIVIYRTVYGCGHRTLYYQHALSEQATVIPFQLLVGRYCLDGLGALMLAASLYDG